MRLAQVALLLLSAPVAGIHAQGPVQLRVEVISEDGAVPLGYAVVSVPSQVQERFTDGAGRVVLALQAGRVLVRVKRLGFVPRDTTFDLAASPGQSLRVALTRVSFKLAPVRIVSHPPCRRPGIPPRGGDAQLRGIVDQLRQNAERYRLLTTAFPFTYEQERESTRRLGNGPEEPERTDTITVRGDITWRYRPGNIVVRGREADAVIKSAARSGPPSTKAPIEHDEWRMILPTISDLADDTFIENHCFHVAGLEERPEGRLLRIDIVASVRLRTPDVNVSVWLDPEGFQLRHATFTLVRAGRFPRILSVISEVDYVEVVPFVPVMHRTVTENVVRGRDATTTYMERQSIVRLTFTGARP